MFLFAVNRLNLIHFSSVEPKINEQRACRTCNKEKIQNPFLIFWGICTDLHITFLQKQKSDYFLCLKYFMFILVLSRK